MIPSTGGFIELLAHATARVQLSLLITVFGVALLAKLITYFVVRRQLAFAQAFDMRVHRHLEGWYHETRKNDLGFHGLTQVLLNRTFHELFAIRKAKERRRRGDPARHVVSKIFLLEQASQQMVGDSLRQTRLMDRYKERPLLENVTAFVLNNNQYFNRVFGFLPVSNLERLFAVLPSLFIITGILGTFLGITQGLPVLRQLDPTNAAAAQATIAEFLNYVTFAMMASVVGVLLSILFTLANAFWSSRSAQSRTFETYTQALDLIWHSADLREEIVPVSASAINRDSDSDATGTRKRNRQAELSGVERGA